MLSFKDKCSVFFGSPIKKNCDYRKKCLFFSLIFIAVLVSMKFAASWYFLRNNKIAQASVSQIIEEYEVDIFNMSLVSEQLDDKIKEIDLACDSTIKKYGSNSISAYALILQSKLMARTGDFLKASDLADRAVKLVSSIDPMHSFLIIDSALFKIDSNDEKLVQIGLASLSKIANDKNNKQADMAAYYLGSYYYSKDDLKKSKEFWTIVKNNQGEDNTASVWYNQIKDKLDQIGG